MSEPGTPLPWERSGLHFGQRGQEWIGCVDAYHWSTLEEHERAGKDAAYIVEACNAYPQLRAALRKLVEAARSREWDSENEYYADGGCRDCLSMSYKKHLKNCPYAAAIAEAERLLKDAT